MSHSATDGNPIRMAHGRESGDVGVMANVLKLIWWTVIGLFRSRASLEAEILTLRRHLVFVMTDAKFCVWA